MSTRRGRTYVDADPISVLRGGPNPDLARRFIEFTLTEEAQALWQFPSKRDPAGATNPVGRVSRAWRWARIITSCGACRCDG
jgi:ABC-type Fe3+ transport system substrate-binding protein